MTGVALPPGFSLEPLQRSHQRRPFDCGQSEVNDWRHTKALQHQDKRLSATKVLLAKHHTIAGFFTLATGQVDFGDLPSDLARKLPRRALPVAILAWLGVSVARQGQKLGDLLLAQSLRDCYEAGQTLELPQNQMLAAFRNFWPEQNLFLNFGGEIGQIHDLRHLSTREVPQAGLFCVVVDFAVTNQRGEVNSERHEPRDPRQPPLHRRLDRDRRYLFCSSLTSFEMDDCLEQQFAGHFNSSR